MDHPYVHKIIYVKGKRTLSPSKSPSNSLSTAYPRYWVNGRTLIEARVIRNNCKASVSILDGQKIYAISVGVGKRTKKTFYCLWDAAWYKIPLFYSSMEPTSRRWDARL